LHPDADLAPQPETGIAHRPGARGRCHRGVPGL